MRGLLLILLIISKLAWAVCAPGTVAFYKFNPGVELVDSCGNVYPLDAVGTPPYSTTTGLCGAGALKVFGNNTAGNYVETPASMDAVMDGATTWTVEGYVYYENVTGLKAIMSDAANAMLFYTNGADFRWFNTPTDTIVFAGGAVVGTCINWAVVATGSATKLYFDGVEKASLAQNNFDAGGVHFGIRKATDDLPLSGAYLSQVRISNVVRTFFPTVNPSSDDEPCMYQGAGCAE